MKCKKCDSINVSVNSVPVIKSKRHSLLYWLLIGWWLEPFMWVLFLLPWLVIKIISKILRGTTIKTKIINQAICQNCGNVWRI